MMMIVTLCPNVSVPSAALTAASITDHPPSLQFNFFSFPRLSKRIIIIFFPTHILRCYCITLALNKVTPCKFSSKWGISLMFFTFLKLNFYRFCRKRPQMNFFIVSGSRAQTFCIVTNKPAKCEEPFKKVDCKKVSAAGKVQATMSVGSIRHVYNNAHWTCLFLHQRLPGSMFRSSVDGGRRCPGFNH